VCPLLRPRPFPENQYVFFEGDDVTSIYFLIKGKCGFVLPKYKNTAYIEIPHGSHFGIIDIVGSILKTQYELDNWFTHKDQLQRQFTVMAMCKCDTISDLYRMKQEFLEAYEKLFNDSYSRLRRALTLKLKAMKICQDVEDDIKS
jgi:CRP-like cAMP-binding protein